MFPCIKFKSYIYLVHVAAVFINAPVGIYDTFYFIKKKKNNINK